MLKVRLLGAFEIRIGEDILHMAGRPEQSLFAYLVLNSGTLHRREKLTALLWPDALDDSARENLRHVLWRVRKTLPASLSTACLFADELCIAFNASADFWLDVSTLKMAKEYRSPDELISVLNVYLGELLPGFNEEWVNFEREYINAFYEHHMARLMAILQKEKRWLDILEWGERWLSFGKRPEPAYRALMCAHKEMGEISEVAGIYARCVRSLREIGLEPSEQTRQVFNHLVAHNSFEIPKSR